MNEHNYKKLFNEATKEPTEENLSALGDWLDSYGDSFWNGECYLLEEGYSLHPIWGRISSDQYYVCGWELKR